MGEYFHCSHDFFVCIIYFLSLDVYNSISLDVYKLLLHITKDLSRFPIGIKKEEVCSVAVFFKRL